jgi:hypothetical protein
MQAAVLDFAWSREQLRALERHVTHALRAAVRWQLDCRCGPTAVHRSGCAQAK